VSLIRRPDRHSALDRAKKEGAHDIVFADKAFDWGDCCNKRECVIRRSVQREANELWMHYRPTDKREEHGRKDEGHHKRQCNKAEKGIG
jgi:hypothetical protein